MSRKRWQTVSRGNNPESDSFPEWGTGGEELVAPGSRDAIEEWLEENGVSL